ncbi:MAG: hypothetical protein ACO1TE_28520 [Prosthecobacter sp.]
MLMLLLCTGCEAPNVFRNETATRPHATLTSDNPPGFHGFFGLGRDVAPYFINHQPTAFWRMGDRFRLPPGPTVLDVITVSEPYDFEPLRFTAVAGHHYILRPTRVNGRDAAALSERPPHGAAEHVVATVLRHLKQPATPTRP